MTCFVLCKIQHTQRTRLIWSIRFQTTHCIGLTCITHSYPIYPGRHEICQGNNYQVKREATKEELLKCDDIKLFQHAGNIFHHLLPESRLLVQQRREPGVLPECCEMVV